MATYPPHPFYLTITTPSFHLSVNVSVHLCIHSSIGRIVGALWIKLMIIIYSFMCYLKKEKMRSCNTTSQRTSLANTRLWLLPTQFWRDFTSLSFFISLQLQTVLLSLIFRWKAAQNSQAKPKLFQPTLLQFHGTVCLELTASHPEMSQHSLGSDLTPKPSCLPMHSSRIWYHYKAKKKESKT